MVACWPFVSCWNGWVNGKVYTVSVALWASYVSGFIAFNACTGFVRKSKSELWVHHDFRDGRLAIGIHFWHILLSDWFFDHDVFIFQSEWLANIPCCLVVVHWVQGVVSCQHSMLSCGSSLGARGGVLSFLGWVASVFHI